MSEHAATASRVTGRPPGQPTLCTPERIAALCDALRKRLPLARACDLIGICDETTRSWTACAERDIASGLSEEESIFVRYLGAVKRVKAEVQQEALERIANAAKANPLLWTADAWYLERTDPEQYGRRDRTTIERNSTSTITIRYVDAEPRPAITGPVIEGEVRQLDSPKVEDIPHLDTTTDMAEPGTEDA